MQQFQFTIEYVKLNLPFRQFLTLITMEEIIYRNYFTHSNTLIKAVKSNSAAPLLLLFISVSFLSL